MIDYRLFRLATVPRTGTTWMMHAASIAGLGDRQKAHVHMPHDPADPWVLRVSTVRHPCRWLASYYSTIHRGHVGVPVVDLFSQLPVGDFDDFVRSYLKRMPGAIGRMFAAYHADVYLRVEDFPETFHELLADLGVQTGKRMGVLTLPPQGTSRRRQPAWNVSLYQRVIAAEHEMLAHFNYLGG